MAHKISEKIGKHTLEPVKVHDVVPCPVCGEDYKFDESYLKTPESEIRCSNCGEIIGVPGEEKEPAKIARPL